MATELIAIAYSPWSEKARWALDYHSVAYTERAYLPLFGAPLLRLRARRYRGRISVPTLIDDSASVMGSLEIASHLEKRHARSRPLIPPEARLEVERWSALSEALLTAGRVVVTHRVSLDRAAKQESLPRQLTGPFGRLARPLADVGIAFLRHKYDFGTAELGDSEAQIAEGLETLRVALAGRTTLLAAFSFADIAMATALQFVCPVDDHYIRLGPASRRCWTQPRLAERFVDLVDWRDRIYAEHR